RLAAEGVPARSSSASSQECPENAKRKRARRESRRGPHLAELSRRDDGVRRQSVDLRLVEEQEEGAEAADTVTGVFAVEARAVPALVLDLRQALVGACAQLVERAELDRLRGA